MVPFLADPDVTLYVGDALETLRGMPDGVVHCALTSPPFYGLRDYGTGSWEGGDEGCDHVKPRSSSPLNSGFNERWGNSPGEKKQENERGEVYRDSCGKCGARRVDQQIGLEPTPDMWVTRLVEVFREVRRVLRPDGTLWVECGDSYDHGSSRARGERELNHGITSGAHGYWSADGSARESRHVSAGLKPKDLLGQPWMLAFALRADGWYLRQAIIWHKPNAMPESVRDRCTTAHSYVFLFAKSKSYFFDAEAIAEESVTGDPRRPYTSDGAWQMDGRALEQRHGGEPRNGHDFSSKNARSVWTIPTKGYPGAHFATWPETLVERIIKAGTSERGVCPECGAPWERKVELDPAYAEGVAYARERRRTGAKASDGGAMVNANAGDLGGAPRTRTVTTLGWNPSCAHGHQPIPATVFDPFMGSGTTALVARRLGRRSIGVELNEKYAEMAARRLQQLSLLAEGAV